MIRSAMRFLLAPLTIAVIDFFVLIPLVLAMVDIFRVLTMGRNFHESMEIVTGLGVILIGWGVALEERYELREIFGGHSHGEDWQTRVDRECKHCGIGLLIFGLFAEMCIEAIKLPNHIINTENLNEALVGVSWFFLAISGYVLVRHIVLLVNAALSTPRATEH